MSNNINEIYLTEKGLDEKKQELDYLKQVRRPEVIKSLKEARALGDLSENAEYDAARNDQAQLEARIKELEVVIEHCIVIKDKISDKVNIGSTVRLKYVEDDMIEEYRIVGSQEADPSNNLISNAAPLAKAIIGFKKGNVVTVDSPEGDYQVEILEIM